MMSVMAYGQGRLPYGGVGYWAWPVCGTMQASSPIDWFLGLLQIVYVFPRRDEGIPPYRLADCLSLILYVQCIQAAAGSVTPPYRRMAGWQQSLYGGQRALRPQARFGGPLDGQRPSVCKANPLVQLQNPLGFALLAITFS